MKLPEIRLEVNPHLNPIEPTMWHTSMGRFGAFTRLTLAETSAIHNLVDIPSEPYQILVQIPEDYSRLSIPQVRSTLDHGQRGLTLIEGLHLAMVYRHLIPVNSVDLLETETRRNGVRHILAISIHESGLLEIGVRNAERNDYVRLPFIFAVSCNRP